ncbi:MAG: TSPc protein [Bacteroidetes bacterium]|nr:TSPc protein [Bacteroidota bacterium]
MGYPSPSSTLRLVIVATIASAVVGLSGCVSSRSLIEGLAKTPHFALQERESYASMNSLQQDFLYLTETLKETHPEPYAAWSEEEFDQEQHRILEVLATETSKVVLEKLLQSFLSHLRDSHTSVQGTWMGGPVEYPASFFWINDTLILASVGSEVDTTLIGSRVMSFNGIPVGEAFTRFARFITYENVYQARRILQYYFVFPTFHRDAGVVHSDTLDLTLIARDGTTRTHRMLPLQQPKRIAPYKSHPITERVNRPFRYSVLKEEKACYLQWNTMMDLRMVRLLSFPTNLLAYPVAWYMGIGYFENFLQDMFEEMKDNEVATLIVDLRGNGGGSSIYGEQLLYYLDVPSNIRVLSMAIRFSPLYREFFPEKYADYAASYAKKYDGKKLPDTLIVTSDFVQTDSSEQRFFQNVSDAQSDYHIKPDRSVFKGNVYFLVGDGTYSSAVILSSLVKDNKLFTTVGQPTRGRPSHYGETLVLKLPNSGVVCRISCKKFFRPETAKDSEGALYPDIIIWPTFEDLKNGFDPVFEWVLQDAKKQNPAARR